MQDAWLNDTPDEDIVQIVKYIANFYNSISAAADPLQVGVKPSCCATKLLRHQIDRQLVKQTAPLGSGSWCRFSIVSAQGLPVLHHGCSRSTLLVLR